MAIAYSPKIVTNGLVLCLDAANPKSYPGTGTAWSDLIGGNTGTLVNGPTYDSDNKGSLVFDGVNDHANCGDSASLQFGTGDFTFCSYIKFLSTPTINSAFIQKRTNVNLGYEIHINENNKIGSSAAMGFGGVSNETIALNSWYHIVVLRNNGVSYLFLNTQLDRSASNTISASSTNNFFLARDFLNNRFLNCSIASVFGYNRALTAAEVQQNFQATRSRFGI